LKRIIDYEWLISYGLRFTTPIRPRLPAPVRPMIGHHKPSRRGAGDLIRRGMV